MDEIQLRKFYSSINQHLRFLNDVSLNADGELTIALIIQTINKYCNSEFIKKCVAVIDSISRNDYEFCKKLFEVSCALIKYRRDPPGHEIVFTPQLLIQVREGDCKKFTTWICAVLKCKGILSAPKVVNYEEPYGWQHIYAIAFFPNKKGYITLDPVNYERFDEEVKFRIGRVNFYDGSKSRYIMTKLSIMGNLPEKNQTFLGIGEAADNILGDLEDISGRRGAAFRKMHEAEQMYIQGIGDLIEGEYSEMSGLDDGIGKAKIVQKVQQKVQQAKQNVQKKTQQVKQNVQHKKEVRKAAAPAKKAQRQEKRAKIMKKAKSLGFGPTRAAFLALIAAGGALAQHTPIKFNLAVKLAQLWQKDGGKSLDEIWQKFGGKRESLKNAIVKASKIQIAGIGIAPGVITAAAITGAPILVLVIKKLSDTGVMSPEAAAQAADVVEQIEDAGTTVDGALNPELTAAVKANPFVEEAVKTDGGGDKQAQRVIQQTVTPNDATPTPTPTSTMTPEAFSDSSSANSSSDSQAAKSSSDSTAETNTNTDSTAATNVAGFNLLNASSWLTGSFTTPAMIGIHFPGHEVIAQIVSSAMFLTSIYLFTNKYFKTKTIKP